MRNVFIRPMNIALFLATAVALAAPTYAGKPKPNVIIILADDLGYADVGCHGCTDIPTPHIDSLARNGIRFTSGYVSHPFCSPTRAGLLTGRYQQRFGHENNPAWKPDNDKLGLPLDQTTVADVLRQAGYVTGAVGKWHLGAAPCFHPNKRGFVEFYGFLGGGHMYLPGLKRGIEYDAPIWNNSRIVDEKEYLTDAFSREALAFIERHKDTPFFLYLAYNAVHTPMQAPTAYVDRFKNIQDEKRRTYAAMLSAMDDGIGRLLGKLDELKLEENTLIFFLSDNGGPPTANASSNRPLRGAKGDLFEGGIRVPFLAQWKGTLKAGTTINEPVSSLDLFPTAAALAGAKLPQSLKLDGLDLLPLLIGRVTALSRERLFWRVAGGKAWAVREGRWKLLHQADGTQSLFDLAADIGEQTDLAARHGDLVDRLANAYADWNQPNIAPLWENPGRARPKSNK